MKKMLLCFCLGIFLLSCTSDKDKETTTKTDDKMDKETKGPADLPFTASYSSSWSTDISDADLKMVLTTYKDWADNNMSGLSNSLADTVDFDMSNGDHKKLTRADLTKMWTTFRDSLSSVKIDMAGWHKMYSTDKKEGYIVTWYDEIDTYKSGKVDSAAYHDINQVKDGKIIWYSQYKRPKK